MIPQKNVSYALNYGWYFKKKMKNHLKFKAKLMIKYKLDIEF